MLRGSRDIHGEMVLPEQLLLQLEKGGNEAHLREFARVALRKKLTDEIRRQIETLAESGSHDVAERLLTLLWNEVKKPYEVREGKESRAYSKEILSLRGSEDFFGVALGVLDVLAQASDNQDAYTSEEISTMLGGVERAHLAAAIKYMDKRLGDTNLKVGKFLARRADYRGNLKRFPAFRLVRKKTSMPVGRPAPTAASMVCKPRYPEFDSQQLMDYRHINF